MFSRTAQICLFAALLAFPTLVQAQTTTGPQEQRSKISIIIDRQLLRFVATQ
jgi:hypothetical protein